MADNNDIPTTDESQQTGSLSRRNMLKATAGAGALAIGGGLSGFVGGAAALNILTPKLSVQGNEIVDPDGNTVTLRGLNIPDPKRMAITAPARGKTAVQLVDKVTNNDAGWHPRAIRVPAQPIDIGEHPNGNPQGPDDTKHPPEPVAFTRQELIDYLEEYYDPVVERCAERGVYCIVDFHRHWHTQPTVGENENPLDVHYPANHEGTNYWAYNEGVSMDQPHTWAAVDELGEADSGWYYDEDLNEEVNLFWDVVAERYADMDHVIYEPYNEPAAPGIWASATDTCGQDRVEPIWQTYLEMSQTWIDTIRSHDSDTLILMGSPGWTQSPRGIYFEDYDDQNLAMTWHNYAGHQVSQPQERNWDNDRQFPNDCAGWEPEEAQGWQKVYEERPLVVTEFGWELNQDLSEWLIGSTEQYGQHIMEAMEQHDSISWTAWCADVWWLPTMFETDFETSGTATGDWYDDDVQIPNDCPNLPCDWSIKQDPHMGQFIKDKLAEYKDDNIPQVGSPPTTGGGTDEPTDDPTDEPTDDTPEPGEQSLSVSVATDQVNADGTVEAAVTLDSAPDGVSGYDIAVQVGDTSVAQITDAAYSDGWFQQGMEVADDGSSVALQAIDAGQNVEAGASDVTLATVTLEGQADGETDVGVAVQALESDADGATIPVATTGDTLTVSSISAIDGTVPQDIDGDGNYEDLNANGRLDSDDVVIFFNNYDQPEMTNHADAYDFNDSGDIDFDDIVQLFNQL